MEAARILRRESDVMQCNAVDRRARAVPAEYATKARSVDQRFCGTFPEQQGPVELRLRSYGDVKALVFGTWGEASTDVHSLLTACADSGACVQNDRQLRVVLWHGCFAAVGACVR